jgi:cobalt-zinc-cadmium efflux system outer membrane protein
MVRRTLLPERRERSRKARRKTQRECFPGSLRIFAASRLSGIQLCIALIVLAGCAAYRPMPIDPPRLEQEFRARNLSSPGLRVFMEASSGVKREEWPLKTFGLAELTLAGLYYNPELEIARARVEAADAAVISAGARPNPSIAIGGGYTNSPESPLVFRFLPGVPIETAGKRGYRILRAQQMAEAARLELAEAAWKVRSAIRSALAGHLFAVEELRLLRVEEAAQLETVKLLDQRFAVGEASRPEADMARAQELNASLSLEAARGRVAETLAVLAGAIGVPASALAGIRFDWPAFERPVSAEALPLADVERAGLLHRIDVRRLLVEYAAADAALRLELARQYPDIDLGPGYDFDEGHHKFTIGPALTLPIFNRNQGPIAEAEARRKEIGARFAAAQAQAIQEMERALAQYRSALAELSPFGAQAVAVQQAREAAAARLIEAGEGDRLMLTGIQVQGSAARRARLEALRKAQAALGLLEDAVQRPLEPGLVMPAPQVKGKTR